MSVLLRHPDRVPALFSRAPMPDAAPAARRPARWRGFAHAASLGLMTFVVLTETPLVREAAAALGLALPR